MEIQMGATTTAISGYPAEQASDRYDSKQPRPTTGENPEEPKQVCLTFAAFVCLLILCKNESYKISKRRTRTRSCTDLPEDILEQMFGRLTAGMFSAFHHTLQLAPLEKQNITCPTGGWPSVDKKFGLPINIHSVSPWGYRISYDPKRYPKYIPEAYCLCKGCLIGPHGEENFHYRSTPVYMPTAVLQRTPSCTGGRYIYTEQYITIPVGCTCLPEQEKDTEVSNSSTDKEEFKSVANKSEKSSS
ncbi:interleukin-17D [Latimeria chalumnae]|uniref:interleukin-17D n=1 Tax=Latimeria chalumnae TaxID=7897 RepID=UPI00313BC407